MSEQPVYGMIGVGALGSAIVAGLCRETEQPQSSPRVVLSPRGAEAASKLAERFRGVTVAASNQEVVDAADVVVLCLRQADAGLLADLTWRPEQTVVSAIAGLTADGLARAVAPASNTARAVPMVMVAEHAWATPVRPPVPAAMALFEQTGGAVAVEDDEAFDAIYTGRGTVAPFFEYLAVIESFLTDHGVAAGDARRLLAGTFSQLLPPGAEHEEPDFEALVRSHAPPGGGNDQLATLLREAGVPDATRQALDEVYRRQTSG